MLHKSVGYHWSTKPPRGSRLIPGHELCQGLTAYYLLNEGSGNLAFDLTRQHSATASGAVWSADAGGIDLSIGATTTQVPVSPSFTIGAVPITLIIWASSAGAATVTNTSPGSYHNNYGFFVSASKMATFYNGTSISDSINVPAGLHMWASTNDGTTGGWTLYRDGLLVNSGTKALASVGASTFAIGGIGSTASPWNGTISGPVMLWVGRAIAASDVAQIYADRYCMIARPGIRR